MFILESIQEFSGKKVGVYNLDKQTTKRIRRAEKEFLRKGMPKYAIFILTSRIQKGEYDFYLNTSSPIQKADQIDGVKKIGTITI
jgi:hypothetical protein